MKIAITGANGFIGNHLLRSLIARGHRPRALIERGSSLRAIADLDPLIDRIEGDLLSAETLDTLLEDRDVVIHLAGYNRYWAKDRAIFDRVNLEGARKLGEACLRHRVEKLVHVSSCVTLGASELPVPRDETASFNLQGIDFPYARSKKAGEEEIRRLIRDQGLPAVIVHPASAIGERDHGPTPIGKPIADISRGLWPVYVGGGACFIDVREVVRGIWLAAEKGRIGESYLLVGENLTNREFMSRIARLAGAREPKFRLPRPLLAALGWTSERIADGVGRFSERHWDPPITHGMSSLVGRYLYFDGRKAREQLGFEPRPVTDAMERSIQWFRSEKECK